jgi:hypothetical protein
MMIKNSPFLVQPGLNTALNSVADRIVDHENLAARGERDRRTVDARDTHQRLQWAAGAAFDPFRHAEATQRAWREWSLASSSPELHHAIATNSLAVRALLDAEMSGVSFDQLKNWLTEQAAYGSETRDTGKLIAYTGALASLDSAARMIAEHDRALRGIPAARRDRNMQPVQPERAAQVQGLHAAIAGAIREAPQAAVTQVSAGAPARAPADPMIERLRTFGRNLDAGPIGREFPAYLQDLKQALRQAEAGRFDHAFALVQTSTERWNLPHDVTREGRLLADELRARRRAAGQDPARVKATLPDPNVSPGETRRMHAALADLARFSGATFKPVQNRDASGASKVCPM